MSDDFRRGIEHLEVDEILLVNEVVDERDTSELLDEAFVGDHGGVEFVVELVEDDAGALQAFGADGIDAEEGVVEGAEAVGDDEDDREIEGFGEVGYAEVGGDGDLPSACAFDEDLLVFGAEAMVAVDQDLRIDRVVFEHSGDKRCNGRVEVDGVDFLDGESARGSGEARGIVAIAAADGFVADRIDALAA